METIELDDVAESIALAPVVAYHAQSDSSRWLAEVRTYPALAGDQETASLYADWMLEAKRKRAEIQAKRDEIVRPQREALNKAIALFREPLDNLEQIERILKSHIAVYEIELRTEAEAKQRELDAQARAERERLAAEAAVKDAAARREAEAGNAQGALDLANEAAATLQAAQSVPTEIAPEPERLAGVSVHMRWVGRVSSKRSALEFIGTHSEYDDLVEFRQAGLDGLARALKGKMRIPGLEAVQVPTVAARGKS